MIKHEISNKLFSLSFSNNATWTLRFKTPPFSYSSRPFGKPLCALINDTIIHPAILLLGLL